MKMIRITITAAVAEDTVEVEVMREVIGGTGFAQMDLSTMEVIGLLEISKDTVLREKREQG